MLQKNKYLEMWEVCFDELLNADPTYVTTSTRGEARTTEQTNTEGMCMLDSKLQKLRMYSFRRN
jgi:hypothetical protein